MTVHSVHKFKLSFAIQIVFMQFELMNTMNSRRRRELYLLFKIGKNATFLQEERICNHNCRRSAKMIDAKQYIHFYIFRPILHLQSAT
jgi:hypothetical protein